MSTEYGIRNRERAPRAPDPMCPFGRVFDGRRLVLRIPYSVLCIPYTVLSIQYAAIGARRPPRLRRGLAPLELLLWLPVLMFVVALFVNVGTMQAWRVRGEIASRDAAWRARSPRAGADEPRPVARVWPPPARFETDDEALLPHLDDPRLDHPVARGPLPNGFQVNDYLAMSQGTYRGEAEMERATPLLPQLRRFESGEIKNALIEDRFTAAEMNLWSNTQRRTHHLYEIPKTDPALPQAYVNAIMALLNMANFDGLAVLDRDEDILLFQGYYRDFHPRIAGGCSLDRDDVYEEQVQRIVDELDEDNEVELGAISLLPRTMTHYFLSMYREAQRRLEEQLAEMRANPDADPAAMEQAERMLGTLPPKIAALEQYQRRLDAIESRLESAYRAYRAALGF